MTFDKICRGRKRPAHVPNRDVSLAVQPTQFGRLFYAGRGVAGIGGVLLKLLMSKMVTNRSAGREIATAMAIFIVGSRFLWHRDRRASTREHKSDLLYERQADQPLMLTGIDRKPLRKLEYTRTGRPTTSIRMSRRRISSHSRRSCRSARRSPTHR